MRITWVARSFLDYRVPVYQSLNELSNGNLSLIYNGDLVPLRVKEKVKKVLGSNAIELNGEVMWNFGKKSEYSNTSYGFRYHKDLISTVRRTNPDILISDGFLKWTYANLFVRAFNLKGIKHIMCYERTKHTERNAGMLRTLYRKIASHWIDVIDCNGILTEEYVKSIGFKKKIIFGHMVADINGLSEAVDNISQNDIKSFKKRYGIEGKVFLYVGRMIELKGIKEMLTAWNSAKLENATLLLVGGGEECITAKEYIDNNNLSNVKILGEINYDNLPICYSSADVFVIATLEDNWSLVVPEAMSCGLPIMCSIYNGCYPELVKPDNGWLFNPLDNDDFKKAFIKAYDDNEKYEAMGNASRNIVSNYTPQKAASQIFEACQLLTKNK